MSKSMGLQHIKRNDVERPLMGGFQIHRARLSLIDCSQPCSGTHAPRITGFEPREVELRGRGEEIVALFLGEREEGLIDHATHGVRSSVAGIGVATPVAIPTRERVV